MTPDRWTLALDGGALPRPEGRCLALMARGDADLAALGGEVLAVQGFRPDFDRLAARGFDVVPELGEEGDFDAALVQIVKSKVRSLSAVAEALSCLKPGGLLMVDGAKEEGIEAILRAVKAVLPVEEVYSKSHGKLFWLRRPDGPARRDRGVDRAARDAGGGLRHCARRILGGRRPTGGRRSSSRSCRS
jgi:16S rRNA (guanine1207-N2)-methyltransferase